MCRGTGAHLGHVGDLAADAALAGLAGHVAEQRVEQRGLAGADAPHHGHHLARVHRELRHRELEAVALVAVVAEGGLAHVDAVARLVAHLLAVVRALRDLAVGVEQEVLDALDRRVGL